MNQTLRFAMQWAMIKGYHKLAILLCLGIIGGMFAFPASFVFRSNVLIGFCLFPFVLFPNEKQRFSYLYFGLILFFGLIAYVYDVRMFYFFAIAFYILFLLERFIGKINFLVLFLMLFMSPFFHQVMIILGFPIRLELSHWAGSLLSFAGFHIKVEGNMMMLNGSIFSVDEACMGLSMLATSLLMGVAAIAHQYRMSARRLTFLQLTFFFTIVFILNVISNLLRIMILVAFQVIPENPMHEIVGVVCLALYVMVPLYFLCKWIVPYGKIFTTEERVIPISFFNTACLTVLAFLLLGVGIHINRQKKMQPEFIHANVELQHFKRVKMNGGITKMHNDNLLVYVKPIPEFFTGEHTPLLCWKGSGYKFQSIKKITIEGNEIYCGQLVKPDGKLYTAWWYSNGKVLTIDQFNWRMRMLKGEDRFCLVNVTAKDEATLIQNVKTIFQEKLLSIKSSGDDTTL